MSLAQVLWVATLTIELQDGFFQEDIVVSLAGRVLFQQEQLSSRPQIGLAVSFAATVAEGSVSLDILLPRHSTKPQVLSLIVSDNTWLGISLDATGHLVSRTASTPFLYA